MLKVKNVQKVLELIKESGIINDQSLKDLKDDEKKLIYDLFNEGMIDEALQLLIDTNADRDWEIFARRIQAKNNTVRTYWKPVLKYAAIFIGLLLIAYFLAPNKNEVSYPTVAKNSIRLRIGDDEVKIIKKGDEQQIVSSSGKVLGKQTGNKISYYSDSEVEELVYNELEIPFGEIFTVELSDGTLVHLNSGTKMRYPVKFIEGQKRVVFIDGEAFFKVAEDKEHPFIVNSGSVNVRVLGTEFNVSAYGEDLETSTVLVSGSVQFYDSLSVDNKHTNLQLVPGQRGTWNKEHHTFEMDKVDTSIYTSWVQGKLIFRDMPFKQIRRQLERRYDVTIVNTDTSLDNNTFSANFEEETIEEILEILDRNYGIEYSIKDNQINIE